MAGHVLLKTSSLLFICGQFILVLIYQLYILFIYKKDTTDNKKQRERKNGHCIQSFKTELKEIDTIDKTKYSMDKILKTWSKVYDIYIIFTPGPNPALL